MRTTRRNRHTRHRETRRRALALLALVLSASQVGAAPPPVHATARASGAFDGDEPRVEARLLIHPDDPGEGTALRVGVLLDVDPGWHVYGRDPGDSGLPTRLRWSLDAGRIGAVHWPAPRTFVEEDGALTTYGYEDRVLLAAPAELDDGLRGEVRVDVDLLACRNECIPASFSLSRPLARNAPASPERDEGVREIFARFAAPLEPAAPAGRTGTRGEPGHAGSIGPALSELLRACLLGVLGGLVLNLMPCVLPVVAIKIVGLTELARRRRRDVVAHAFAYGLGVLAAMSALAGAVVGLRAAGASVGWGFQFQEPLFVAAVSATVVVFALNLLGVFEIQADTGRLAGLGSGATGARRSFFDGLLAVVLATPCSAPFLGTAVGFAFARSAPTVIAIFLSIGVGLAAPFVLVALHPASARLLPRPGPWMLGLRRILGLALLATAIWLVWIEGRILGPAGMATLAALLVAVGAGAWALGALQAAGSLRSTLPAALALVALTPLGLDLAPLPPPPAMAGAPEHGGVQRYSRDALEAELARGRPAFVYFTADWCLTCKVNERSALADPSVREEMTRLDVAVFRADWTRRDETLRAELARFGRSGVPLYLVFRPGAPEAPRILPELLTRDGVRAALRDAAAVTARTRDGEAGGEEQSADTDGGRPRGRKT